MTSVHVPATFLGQAGVRLQFPACVVYIDPYLSDSVARTGGGALARLVPSPMSADSVRDADWVLITHDHLDHCDPDTIIPIAANAPSCRFMGPEPVRALLLEWGIDPSRIHAPSGQWADLAPQLRVHAVPAAHPRLERDRQGDSLCVGYVLEYAGRRIYHSGDTSPAPELEKALATMRPIHTALLPVNERNYYRERADIIGNMSLREAFQFATDLGVAVLVPIHWDLFAPNAVYREEIELLYALTRPPFRLSLMPTQL